MIRTQTDSPKTVAVIGGGPAGLMAAETLAHHDISVELYDAMPSVGRKFLIAGKGGLNITHAEPFEQFITRYGDRRPQLEPYLTTFGPSELRAWLHELGFETFVGTSGKVFPRVMKAGPVLHAWRERLSAAGVKINYAIAGWVGQRMTHYVSKHLEAKNLYRLLLRFWRWAVAAGRKRVLMEVGCHYCKRKVCP
jgi:predicted flavoprotein YhiN